MEHNGFPKSFGIISQENDILVPLITDHLVDSQLHSGTWKKHEPQGEHR